MEYDLSYGKEVSELLQPATEQEESFRNSFYEKYLPEISQENIRKVENNKEFNKEFQHDYYRSVRGELGEDYKLDRHSENASKEAMLLYANKIKDYYGNDKNKVIIENYSRKNNNDEDKPRPRKSVLGKVSYKVGGFYEGIKTFVEFENDKLYCPDSSYCLIKCYNKYYEITKQKNRIDTKLFGPYSNTLQSVNEAIKNFSLCECDVKHVWNCPKNNKCKCKKDHKEDCKKTRDEIFKNLHIDTYTIVEKNGNKLYFEKMEQKTKGCNSGIYKIVLLTIGKNNLYHAILVKGELNNNYEEFMENIRVTDDKVLKENNIDCGSLEDIKIKKFENRIFVYDIETFVQDNNKGVKRFEKDEFGKNVKDQNGKYISNIIEEKSERLIPYALSITILNLETGIYDKPDMIRLSVENDGYLCNDIYDKMIEYICEKIKKNKMNKNVQIFAHNGSRFDNIYARCLSNGKIHSLTGSPSCIKSMTIIPKEKIVEIKGEMKNERKNITIDFKDSWPFTLKGLKDLGKDYEVENGKIEFDIVGKDRKFYEETTDWIEYMHSDVKCLSEVLYKVEQEFRKLSQSITTSIGLPGIAWKHLNNTCTGMKELSVPKSPSLIKFIQSSLYGGRVNHYKKEFDHKDYLIFNGKSITKKEYEKLTNKKFDKKEFIENGGTTDRLVCIDGNSLYPSAMYAFEYPLRKPILISNREKFDEIRENKKLYVVEVEMILPQKRYNYIPYRTKIGSNLIYPTGNIAGVYNSVDLEEMILDGAIIHRFIQGIYYDDKARIFTETIRNLYDERQKKESICEKSGESLKNVTNSAFGKFLEIIDDGVNYVDVNLDEIRDEFKKDFHPFNAKNTKNTKNKQKGSWRKIEVGKDLLGNIKYKEIFECGNFNIMSAIPLPNGQTEFKYKYENSLVKKPLQIGSFILGYARKLMNNVIRVLEPENIWYGDTDSLYVLKSSYDNAILNYPHLFNKEGLTGFKNDYGEGKFITKAIFADYKRYYMELFSDKIKEKDLSKEVIITKKDYFLENIKQKIEIKKTKKFEDLEKFNEKGEKVVTLIVKSKFVGLNWKHVKDGIISDQMCGDISEEMAKVMKKTFESLLSTPLVKVDFVNDKWKRVGIKVEISKKSLSFSANPQSRAFWTKSKKSKKEYDHIYNPLTIKDFYKDGENECKLIDKYNDNDEDRRYNLIHKKDLEYKKITEFPNYIDEMNKMKTVNYVLRDENNKTVLKSCLPIMYTTNKIEEDEILVKEEKDKKSTNFDNFCRKNLVTSYVKYKDNMYIHDNTGIYTVGSSGIHQPVSEDLKELISEKGKKIIAIAEPEDMIPNTIDYEGIKSLLLHISSRIGQHDSKLSESVNQVKKILENEKLKE
jgi:hypothetical protein